MFTNLWHYFIIIVIIIMFLNFAQVKVMLTINLYYEGMSQYICV